MKKWLCLFICCCLLLPVVAACGDNNGPTATDPTPEVPDDTPTILPMPITPTETFVLNFADGKTDFLALNTGTPGTDRDSEMSLVDLDGAKALKLTAPNGRTIRLGIDVSGLLGDRVTDVKNIVFDIYAGYPDGNFSAVSGIITAMSGEAVPFADTNWQIYLETRNPNPTTLELGSDYFDAAGPNILEFACITNGPANNGETPADIYIKSITFFDTTNNAIEINTGAGFKSPDGWGEFVVLGGFTLPVPPEQGRPGDWQTWHTPGVDGNDDDHMPWEKLAASFGITFEMENEPESFGLVVFGAFNGWSSPNWGNNYAEYWEDGKLTIMWEDYGFDPSEVNEDNDGVKISFADWEEVGVSVAYLLVGEDD